MVLTNDPVKERKRFNGREFVACGVNIGYMYINYLYGIDLNGGTHDL